MELLKAVLLGLVQGLSEFLPISSSGHLVLFSEILNFKDSGIAFDVFVHFGTLLAVLVAFRRDIWQMVRGAPGLPRFIGSGCPGVTEEDRYQALSLYIVVGSIPAAVIGILFEDPIETLFNNPLLVLFALLLTALIVWSSRYTRESSVFLNGKYAFLIGIAQAFAIIPGISRSGSTIVAGLWLGVHRETAARFSFLLSVPVILGATLLKFMDLLKAPPSSAELANLIAGTFVAAVSGYLAILWLLDLVRKQKLEWFGVYCASIGISGLIFLFFRT